MTLPFDAAIVNSVATSALPPGVGSRVSPALWAPTSSEAPRNDESQPPRSDWPVNFQRGQDSADHLRDRAAEKVLRISLLRMSRADLDHAASRVRVHAGTRECLPLLREHDFSGHANPRSLQRSWEHQRIART